MGTRKTSHDVSPRLRHAFFEGLLLEAEEQGKTLEQLCKTYWHEDWRAAAAILAKFMPRELNVDATVETSHSLPLSATQAFIEAAISSQQPIQAAPEPLKAEILPEPDTRHDEVQMRPIRRDAIKLCPVQWQPMRISYLLASSSAAVVIGQQDGEFFLLAAMHESLDDRLFKDKIISLHQRWKPTVTASERAIEDLEAELNRRHYHFTLDPLESPTQAQIYATTLMIETGRLLLPQELIVRDSEGNRQELMSRFMTDLNELPHYRRDGLLPVLAHLTGYIQGDIQL